MTADTHRVLVLGGARSGKSAYAETLAEAHAGARIYIATAAAHDGEMAERIAAHRARRGADWHTVEEEIALADALSREAGAGRFVLVDCITLWITNLLLGGHDVDTAVAGLCSMLDELAGTIVLVANEVGLGIVPDNALARQFRDHAGSANQRLGAHADEVVFIAAGLPLHLKPGR